MPNNAKVGADNTNNAWEDPLIYFNPAVDLNYGPNPIQEVDVDACKGTENIQVANVVSPLLP